MAAGVFGYLDVPDADDVRAMTEEHARELASILAELDHLRRCARWAIEPVRGNMPRSHERRERLTQRLTAEAAQLEQHYEDALAAYGEGFGWEAADALDRFVKDNLLDATPEPRPPVQQELF